MFTGQVSVLIVGGTNNNAYQTDVEILPYKENCSLPKLWGPIDYPSIFQHGSDILLCGNEGNEGICWKLNRNNAEWVRYNSLLTTKNHPFYVVSMKSETFLFGRSTDDNNNFIGVSDVLKHRSDTWQKGPELPSGFLHNRILEGSCGIKISDDELLIIGGSAPETTVLKLNTSENSWHNTTINLSAFDHRCIVLNRKIIITGGIGLYSTFIIDILDDDKLELRGGGNLSKHRQEHGMGIINLDSEFKVIAFGGVSTTGEEHNSVEMWNDSEETWSNSGLILQKPKLKFGFGTFPTELLCPNAKLSKN